LKGRGHTAACDVQHNGGMTPPWYWRQQGNTEFHAEREGEYVEKMGSELIQKTLPFFRVEKCLRIEDSTLWSSYAACRAEIRVRNPSRLDQLRPETSKLLGYSASTTLDASVNEVWLFHGTSEEAAFSIAKSDFRVPSAEGHFGKGLYFAEKASKSHPYSQETADGCKVMLLCRVVLGNILEIEGTDPRGEERVVGTSNDSLLGTTDAREFVIYDIRQAYPEYVMYYKVDKELSETPEAALFKVMEMGFSESQARGALEKAGGYDDAAVQRAIELLFGG